MLRHLSAAFLLAVAVGGLSACQATHVVLKVGDCINYEPTEEGENSRLVDCAQPHAEEVFSVFDFPNATTAFPGYEAIGALQQTRCQVAFDDYVGISWEQSAYSLGFSGPTEATWADGDHAIACTLEDANGQPLTGSARGTAR